MKLLEIEIENFRGIRNLVWNPDPGFNLLLGPGDSCKTTILDAIDYVLGPRWNLSIGDTDFYGASTDNPIEIKATVGSLPQKLKEDLRFETHYRGWTQQGLVDEPKEDDSDQELVLTIRLHVSASLEPEWTIWTERQTENPPAFRVRDRELLGTVRVGNYVDRHLTWGKGSALHQFSDDIGDLRTIFSEVRREAQQLFAGQNIPELRAITDTLTAKATVLGVQTEDGFNPGLEASAIQSTSAGVGLFSGKIPTRQLGLGSRRLLVTTMQIGREDQKSLLLLDEIESALEPHRIRCLIRTLIESGLQVIASTHSSTAIQESRSQSCHYVHLEGDIHKITPLDDSIKASLQKAPNAPLAKKVLVCEGKTETGFYLACKEIWKNEREDGLDTDALGVVETYGEGAPQAGKLAKAYAATCKPTGYYHDNDRGPGVSQAEATEVGLKCFTYSENTCTERAFFRSLTADQISSVLSHLKDNKVQNMHLILEDFFTKPVDPTTLWDDSVKPLDGKQDAVKLLTDLATGHKHGKERYTTQQYWPAWLKDDETAREVMLLVAKPWDTFKFTEIGKVLEEIRKWSYGVQ